MENNKIFDKTILCLTALNSTISIFFLPNLINFFYQMNFKQKFELNFLSPINFLLGAKFILLLLMFLYWSRDKKYSFKNFFMCIIIAVLSSFVFKITLFVLLDFVLRHWTADLYELKKVVTNIYRWLIVIYMIDPFLTSYLYQIFKKKSYSE